jgi:hypothetical protein
MVLPRFPSTLAVASVRLGAPFRTAANYRSGRSVNCAYSPEQGYRVLSRILNISNWRQTVRDALYFEKPHDKRRRLCRERSEQVFRKQISQRVEMANKMLELYVNL